jgi:hypothetical protein
MTNGKIIASSAVMFALLATTAVTPALARGGGGGNNGGHHPTTPPPPVINVCDTGLCDPDLADFNQQLAGFQDAINKIVDVDDATKIVQEAVNAGNLINVATGASIDLANAHQYADLYQFAYNKLESGWHKYADFTDVTQEATNVVNSITGDIVVDVRQASDGSQIAKNLIDGSKGSTFVDLSQAATNVVNSLTATTSKSIEQANGTDQLASNVMKGGWGGYDTTVGASVDWTTADRTQEAVNAANLVNLDSLTLGIEQKSHWNEQTALNTAVFYGGATLYDLGQSATNVTNSVSVGSIDPLNNGCGCYGGWEVGQYASVDQLAKNLISTMGDVNNSIQSATNVANSISIKTPAE